MAMYRCIMDAYCVVSFVVLSAGLEYRVGILWEALVILAEELLCKRYKNKFDN